MLYLIVKHEWDIKYINNINWSGRFTERTSKLYSNLDNGYILVHKRYFFEILYLFSHSPIGTGISSRRTLKEMWRFIWNM